MKNSQQKQGGNLLHNMVLFGRLLRALGMDVNPGRMVDLVRALEHVQVGRRPDFYFTARSLLVHEKDDLPLFDEAFELFWKRPSNEEEFMEVKTFPTGSGDDKPPPPIVTSPLPQQEDEDKQAPDEPAEEEAEQELIELTKTYSSRELLANKDFSELTQEEMSEIKRVMNELVWNLGQRRTRRLRAARRGQRLDLRRSLRRNLRYGGEIIEWPQRTQKLKPRPLIVIADISGSMERYTRLLLHFIYSLAEGLDQEVEAFVFGTQLTRITRQLRGRDVEKAVDEVSQSVQDWSGGTRIGEAIKTFNFRWGRRVLGRGAVALIISDGWDRGDPNLLGKEMGRLQRSCFRTIWLNPLLGSDRYEPLTRGIVAALPHIDDFLPVHNLNSLEDLAEHLAQLTVEKRPSSRQKISLSGAAFISP